MLDIYYIKTKYNLRLLVLCLRVIFRTLGNSISLEMLEKRIQVYPVKQQKILAMELESMLLT